MTTTVRAPTRPDTGGGRAAARADLLVVAGAAALVVVVRWWGERLVRDGAVLLLASGEPLMGPVRSRVGSATVAALTLAAVFVVVLPGLADRLRWSALLPASAVGSAAWSVTLALVDGRRGGFVDRLTGRDEYLHDVHRFTGGPIQLLHTFAGRIHTTDGSQWATHVGGHPPGALLTFWTVTRLGGGAGWSAALCVAGGALAVPAVLLTVRAVDSEQMARRAAPFLVVAPAAVWVAVSADAWFLGVTAWGIACLALSVRRRSDPLALTGGLLLGFGCYLSYGLVLVAPLAVAVAVRRPRTVALGLVGVLAVVAAFTAGGFWWWDGLQQTRLRVAAGAAAARPYSYFLVANVAALVIAVGPSTVAGLARLRRGMPLGFLAVPALAGIAVADLTGLSRGEVERIWLPFMPWLVVAAAVLPARHRRAWLAGQLAVGIVVQTLVVSLW